MCVWEDLMKTLERYKLNDTAITIYMSPVEYKMVYDNTDAMDFNFVLHNDRITVRDLTFKQDTDVDEGRFYIENEDGDYIYPDIYGNKIMSWKGYIEGT